MTEQEKKKWKITNEQPKESMSKKWMSKCLSKWIEKHMD